MAGGFLGVCRGLRPLERTQIRRQMDELLRIEARTHIAESLAEDERLLSLKCFLKSISTCPL